MKPQLKVLSFILCLTLVGSFSLYAAMPAMKYAKLGEKAEKKDGKALTEKERIFLITSGLIDKNGNWIKQSPEVQLDPVDYGNATAIVDNTASVEPTVPVNNQCPNNFFCRTTHGGITAVCIYGSGTRDCNRVAQQCRAEEEARAQRLSEGKSADQGSTFPEYSKYCKD